MTATIKLNPTQLLSQLADTKSSGCLEIDKGAVSWKIYLQQGNVQYVYCSAQLLDQFKYYLHYLGWKSVITALKELPPSCTSIQNSSPAQNLYSKIIVWLLTERHLDLSQVSQLIQTIAKDELQSCLLLESGTSSWQAEHSLPLWIPVQIKDSLSFDLSKYLNEVQSRLKQWQSCSDKLLSVHQRPYFPPSWETQSLPASGSLNHQALKELTSVLRGRTSIRQLSILLKKDELQVAKILSPYIDEKIIYLHHAAAPLNQLPQIPHVSKTVLKSPLLNSNNAATTQPNAQRKAIEIKKIVCIDDSPTILSEMQRFLSKNRFQVTAIDDPIQAASKVFSINPDLILMDITMPKINGYKLCSLLRSSGKCNDTPIIMVTGNTGMIDKARAKLSGATDYFTKPFTKEGLNKVVNKHLN